MIKRKLLSMTLAVMMVASLFTFGAMTGSADGAAAGIIATAASGTPTAIRATESDILVRAVASGTSLASLTSFDGPDSENPYLAGWINLSAEVGLRRRDPACRTNILVIPGRNPTLAADRITAFGVEQHMDRNNPTGGAVRAIRWTAVRADRPFSEAQLNNLITRGGIIHIGFGELSRQVIDGRNVNNVPADAITFERIAPRPRPGRYVINYIPFQAPGLASITTIDYPLGTTTTLAPYGSWVMTERNAQAPVRTLEYSRHSSPVIPAVERPHRALLRIPAGFSGYLDGLGNFDYMRMATPTSIGSLTSIASISSIGVPVVGVGARPNGNPAQAREPWFVRTAPVERATGDVRFTPASLPRRVNVSGVRLAPNARLRNNAIAVNRAWATENVNTGLITPPTGENRSLTEAGTYRFWVGVPARGNQPRSAATPNLTITP